MQSSPIVLKNKTPEDIQNENPGLSEEKAQGVANVNNLINDLLRLIMRHIEFTDHLAQSKKVKDTIRRRALALSSGTRKTIKIYETKRG